jgi:hypothetical protein
MSKYSELSNYFEISEFQDLLDEIGSIRLQVKFNKGIIIKLFYLANLYEVMKIYFKRGFTDYEDEDILNKKILNFKDKDTIAFKKQIKKYFIEQNKFGKEDMFYKMKAFILNGFNKINSRNVLRKFLLYQHFHTIHDLNDYPELHNYYLETFNKERFMAIQYGLNAEEIIIDIFNEGFYPIIDYEKLEIKTKKSKFIKEGFYKDHDDIEFAKVKITRNNRWRKYN